MRLLQKLGAAALAGATLAACGSTVHTSTVTSKTAASKGTASKGTASKTVPNAPSTKGVGFNSNKTVFVLPYHLGNLPAPELALAKANSAYASGLADPSDWIDVKPGPNAEPSQYGWFYTGSLENQFLGSLIEVKTEVPIIWQSFLDVAKGYPGVTVTDTANVAIDATTLGNFPNNYPNLTSQLEGHGYTIVTPSTLEVRAAPDGSFTVNGVTLGAFCVPSPEAVLQNGHVVTPVGMTPC
jgi:hypothetical protein